MPGKTIDPHFRRVSLTQGAPPMIARPVPASACCLAYATALAAACFAAPYAERAPWLPGDLWKGLALDVLGTAVVFRFSRRYSNSSVYDPFWVLAPLALGFYWKAKAPGGFWYYEPRETMCLVLLWAWATRYTPLPLRWPRAEGQRCIGRGRGLRGSPRSG